jgi:5'-3' exonuclease
MSTILLHMSENKSDVSRSPAPLLIADVPWLLYRAFFSLPKSIVDGEGQPVNALLGTVNALLNAADTCQPRAIAACFGAEQATYRVELYEPYHAHRDPMPSALAAQWERAPALLEALGWAVYDSDELEADDAMGSLARLEARAGGRALLLSGDRDMYQAVDERVAVLEPKRGAEPVEVGPEAVRERYGIGPELVPDFIALRGDPSDGLPGAPGIGAKGAAELLSTHGSLEAVLAAAESPEASDRPRHAATLAHHAELLRTFKRVATLVEMDLERPPDRPTNFADGAAAARSSGLNKLAARLEEIATA